MTTKTLLKNYIDERTRSADMFPSVVQKGINTIAGEIPFKLKLAITLSELITFSSHLRKPIELYDGTLVPTNAIVFALSASGTSKDKSLNTIRKSLSTAYAALEEHRRAYAREKAEKKAYTEEGSKSDWAKYYINPKPLQAGLGTVEGLMHHFADIASNPMGAGSIMSSEIGTELQNNSAMVDIIKTVSVAYDLGNIPAKVVKSSENQTSEVKALPVNALFFGSQDALLFNNEIKSKFKMVFNTQLARRSLFSFTPEMPQRVQITSIDDLYELRERERKRVLQAQEELDQLTSDLVEKTDHKPLRLSKDATKLFDVYLEYNSILSDEMSNKHPISKLSRKHKQWLALKLAGTYAILHGSDHISETDYSFAINTVELLSKDLMAFEHELVKEPYEQLVDMCRYRSEDGEFYLSLHELRKLSYVTGSGTSKSKVEELCVLANSYDAHGTYSVHDGGILYKEIVKTDVVGVSYKIFNPDMPGTEFKDFAKTRCADGYEFYETDFAELEELLKENAVYSPFQFLHGKRGKDFIDGGTKFVVMDVDKSQLSDEEVHTLLEQYNHFVVRTSDPDNAFKYRVLMELDSVVDIDDRTWKAFLTEVADELGLVLDLVPKSQIFLSYADRVIMKQLDGDTLHTKPLLERAAARMKDKPKPPAQLPSTQKKLKLEDPRETFGFAFEGEKGERSILMYRALAYAIDLGADEKYLVNLANEINNYWVEPMDQGRLERTLIQPALRRLP